MKKPLAITLGICIMGLLLTSCGGGEPTVTGYWEGDGMAMEVLMKDEFKELTKSVDYEFWFSLDEEGQAVGEIELVYDANLVVDVPKPVAEIEGKVTDLDPKRRFDLAGLYNDDGETLVLEVVMPEEENRDPIDFTITANIDVPNPLPLGLSAVPLHAGEKVEIPYPPFSPLGQEVSVEKRPNGPYAARYEDKGESHAIEWSARQMGGEQRSLEMSPEIEDALRGLRNRLGGQ